MKIIGKVYAVVQMYRAGGTHERLLYVCNSRVTAEDLRNYLTEESGFNEWYGVKEVSLLDE